MTHSAVTCDVAPPPPPPLHPPPQQNKVAEGVLRRSLAAAGVDPHTQRLLGDALANQNQAEQAIAAYETVLSSTDDAEDRAAATSGIAAMRAVIA